MVALARLAGNIAHFAFRVKGFDADELRVTGFDGTEGLSELFEFRVQLCSDRSDIEPERLIGQAATLEIEGEHGVRCVQGIIRRFEYTNDAGRLTCYEASIVPPHWLLTRRIRSRIFQKPRSPNMDVPGIVRQVLDEAGLPCNMDSIGKLQRYEERDFVVQYRESEWDFISRLLEEEGIYYYFDHGADGCTLVLADHKESHRPYLEDEETRKVPYCDPNGMVPEEEFVHRIRLSSEIQIGAVTLDDFDFRRPDFELRTAALAERFTALSLTDYPADFTELSRGNRLAARRLEEQQAAQRVARMTATVRQFCPGRTFELVEHPTPSFNGEYLITQVTHRAMQTQSSETEGGYGAGCRYEADLRTIPAEVQFRPPRVTPKASIPGSQTAIVTGPSGEEIHTDEYGRVKVRFHWDQEGGHDENASCWIRVSQGMAGGGYGMMFLPRVGQEVVVDFLEGDPDQPLIVGRVYNADHMPPYPLPQQKTRSVIKTNSSRGGGGTNEICFEDEKDAEQILIHAQKDLHLRVKNDRVENVERDYHLTVAQNRHELVKQSVTSEVKLDLTQKIGGKKSLSVTGDIGVDAKGNVSTTAKGAYYVNAKSELVLESASAITLKVGGNFIKIDASGIVELGKMIKLNSGGAAGMGTPVQLKEVTDPLEADGATPGRDTNYAVDPAALGALTHESPNGSGRAPVEEKERQTSWIEIELVDEMGRPVPGEAYEIIAPDGKTIRKGTLDQNGQAHEALPDPGLCQISFPKLDAAAWEPQS